MERLRQLLCVAEMDLKEAENCSEHASEVERLRTRDGKSKVKKINYNTFICIISNGSCICLIAIDKWRNLWQQNVEIRQNTVNFKLFTNSTSI